MAKIDNAESALSERISVLQAWFKMTAETERTAEIQPVYVRLWEKLGARLDSAERPKMQDIPTTVSTEAPTTDIHQGVPSVSCRNGFTTPLASSNTTGSKYRGCYVCDGAECPVQQPVLSQIPIPNGEALPDWTAHRLNVPAAYEFNEHYAAIRLAIATAAVGTKDGGTNAVKGASRPVQFRSFSKITGSTGMWAEYDLMTSVWLSFTVVSLHRSSGMQPIMAFQQAAMACTIPDYAGTPDGEDQKYAAAALKLSAKGFGTIAKHNERGQEGAEMIAAVLTRPGYGRHTGETESTSSEDCDSAISIDETTPSTKTMEKTGIDPNTWLHMRWYDGGVVPYFMCHDWSLRDDAIGRLTTQHPCSLVDSCYDITIWLNDLSDYALDRTIGEGGNSLVYALSQSGKCKPSILADFCSDILSRISNCHCNSKLHETAGDIAVGFTAMYALAFRYRGLENAWLARDKQVPGIVQKGWLIQGGSLPQEDWPRVPYRSDWGPLTTIVPTQIDLETARKCWQARCGRLAADGPGESIVNHLVAKFSESQKCDDLSVCEALEQIWLNVELATRKMGGDSAAIYTSLEDLVLSVIQWPAIFASLPAHRMDQCSVRDKVALENILLESAAYGLWCCGTSEASEMVRFLSGLVACVSELTIVATYRRVPLLWSEDKMGWEATEHMDCTHPVFT